MSTIREIERQSILDFLTEHEALYKGARVLDWGSGTQRYRDLIIHLGGIYHAYDNAGYPASIVTPATPPANYVTLEDVMREPDPFDIVVCTQVIQYHPFPVDMLRDIRMNLAGEGHLLITGPTNWPVVENEDLHRFTMRGIVSLLGSAGFGYVEARYRARVKHEGETWELGWAAVARP